MKCILWNDGLTEVVAEIDNEPINEIHLPFVPTAERVGTTRVSGFYRRKFRLIGVIRPRSGPVAHYEEVA